MGGNHMKFRDNTQVKLYVIPNTPGYQSDLQEMTVVKGLKVLSIYSYTLKARQFQEREAFWSLNNLDGPSAVITFPI